MKIALALIGCVVLLGGGVYAVDAAGPHHAGEHGSDACPLSAEAGADGDALAHCDKAKQGSNWFCNLLAGWFGGICEEKQAACPSKAAKQHCEAGVAASVVGNAGEIVASADVCAKSGVATTVDVCAKDGVAASGKACPSTAVASAHCDGEKADCPEGETPDCCPDTAP